MFRGNVERRTKELTEVVPSMQRLVSKCHFIVQAPGLRQYDFHLVLKKTMDNEKFAPSVELFYHFGILSMMLLAGITLSVSTSSNGLRSG